MEAVAEIPSEALPILYRSAYFRTRKARMGNKLCLGAYENVGEMPAARF